MSSSGLAAEPDGGRSWFGSLPLRQLVPSRVFSGRTRWQLAQSPQPFLIRAVDSRPARIVLPFSERVPLSEPLDSRL